jgi:hypothetical protein
MRGYAFFCAHELDTCWMANAGQCASFIRKPLNTIANSRHFADALELRLTDQLAGWQAIARPEDDVSQ